MVSRQHGSVPLGHRLALNAALMILDIYTISGFLRVQNSMRTGKFDCLIKTKSCVGSRAHARKMISAQCSECCPDGNQLSAGKRRE